MTSLNLPARVPSRYLPAKVNNRNTRTRCEICPKLTIKIPEQRHWRVFTVNFENISHLILVYLLLNLNMQLPAGLNLICEFNLGLDFSESSSAGISLFKVNNGITKTIYEICYWRRSGAFIVNFEQISYNVLVIPL